MEKNIFEIVLKGIKSVSNYKDEKDLEDVIGVARENGLCDVDPILYIDNNRIDWYDLKTNKEMDLELYTSDSLKLVDVFEVCSNKRHMVKHEVISKEEDYVI
tara:strand:+ start:7715 stop:8020 length:306 start_codon:yes stop_codon:yes gene_type:complete